MSIKTLLLIQTQIVDLFVRNEEYTQKPLIFQSWQSKLVALVPNDWQKNVKYPIIVCVFPFLSNLLLLILFTSKSKTSVYFAIKWTNPYYVEFVIRVVHLYCWRAEKCSDLWDWKEKSSDQNETNREPVSPKHCFCCMIYCRLCCYVFWLFTLLFKKGSR